MATFSITADTNINTLVGKTGNDSYSINGGTFRLDTDTRYSSNSSPTTGPMANITMSAALGGVFRIDSTKTFMVPFDGGSGTVPAYNTALSQASGCTGELLMVMSQRTGGIVYTPGTAMPATGWIKIKVLTGSFSTGAITGINANSTSDQEVSWLMIVGTQNKSFIITKVGYSYFYGNDFHIGVTTGVRNQQLQLPFINSEVIVNYPGVEIETTPGSDIYDFWPSVANRFTSVNCSTDSRSSFVDISTAGVLTIGRGRDGIDCGHLPVAGCKIRIPNLITQTADTSNLSRNTLTHTSINSRFRANYTSAGNIVINKITGDWYWAIVQAYNVNLQNLHACDQVVIQEAATQVIADNIHVGLSNYSVNPMAVSSILFQQNYYGGVVGKMSGIRAEATSTSGYNIVLVNLYGKWTFDKIRGGHTGVPSAISGSVFFNTCDDVVVNLIESFTKRVVNTSCNRLVIKRLVYADVCIGTTPTTQATHAFENSAQTADVTVTNIENWPAVPNCHPYNGLFFCNTSKRAKLRYCGTPSTPFNAGTVNPMAYIFSDGGNNNDIKIQRNWVTGLRTSISSGTNTTKNLIMVNNYNTDGSKTIGPQQLESQWHGNRTNGGGVPNSYIAVYGTSMWDSFTSDTTTRASVIFAEKTPATPDLYVINSGTPNFTSQGAVVFTTAGDSITWTWPWMILGWTGLTSFAVQGTNFPNHLAEYDLDKGNGFSGSFKTVSNANLLAETGIDPVIGFRFRIRISAIVSNINNRIDSFRIDGTTTLALQNEALYPLDNAELIVSGLLAGSTVGVFAIDALPGDEAITYTTNSGTEQKLIYPYDEAVTKYKVRIRKAGYDVMELEYDNNLSTIIPVSQQENKDGFGVPIYGRAPNTTQSFITISESNLRYDIGNFRCIAEDVYDYVSEWQATAVGLRYPEGLRFDGTDLLLVNGWRFRRALLAYTSAGIDALPVVDGQPNASPDDEVNGSVDFKARSVRTYQINAQPVYTLNDLAHAVWTYGQGNGLSAETNLLAIKATGENTFALTASI